MALVSEELAQACSRRPPLIYCLRIYHEVICSLNRSLPAYKILDDCKCGKKTFRMPFLCVKILKSPGHPLCVTLHFFYKVGWIQRPCIAHQTQQTNTLRILLEIASFCGEHFVLFSSGARKTMLRLAFHPT